MIHSALKLCLVTQANYQSLDNYLEFLELAIQGGVTSIQLRDKINPLSKIRRFALALKSLKAPLIINDYVELAQEVDADGVHLGQTDCSPQQARKILGTAKIIGYSIESLPDLERANQLTCIDYIAASAVFRSNNKQDCKTIWGLKGLHQLTKLSKHPVVAIGGIDKNNVSDVIAHGACGIAVIGAIHDNFDSFSAASELIKLINKQNV